MIETEQQESNAAQIPNAAQFASSTSFGKLAEALAKAQGEIQGAKKDSDNPFFKSKYADLASVWEACRQPLSQNGLAIVQLPGSNGDGMFVDTILTHATGEWISSRLFMTPVQDTPQGVGSAITYARRYGLQAMVGIAPEDDDGNAASGTSHDAAKQDRRDQEARHAGREQPSVFTGKWEDARVHFGKVGGKIRDKRLADLPENTRVWLFDELTKKEKPTAKDKSLLEAVTQSLNKPDGSSAPSDELPMFNGPNHGALHKKLLAEFIGEQTFLDAMIAQGALAEGSLFAQITDDQAKQFLSDWPAVEAALKPAATK